MRHFFWILLLGTGTIWAQKATIGNLQLDGFSSIPEATLERIDRYQQGRSAAVADWLDSELIITTRFGNVTQLHIVEDVFGDRQQITFDKEGVNNAQVCPGYDELYLLYSADKGGNENFQLFLLDLDSKEAWRFTDGKSRNVSARWNSNGDKIVYLSNARNSADLDLYLFEMEDYGENPAQSSMLMQQKGGGWNIVEWSTDGRYLVLSDYVSVEESQLYLYDMDKPTVPPRMLWPKAEKRSVGSVVLHNDSLLYISNYQSDLPQIRCLNLSTNTDEVFIKSEKHEIETMTTESSREWIAYALNVDGYSEVYLRNLLTGSVKKMELPATAVVQGMRLSDHELPKLAMSLAYATSPTDVAVYDAKEKTQICYWTQSEIGPLDEEALVNAELIKYKSFDGLEIPAFIYKAESDKPSPVLIMIHGGPEGQSLPTYNPLIQYWVKELGITVIVPNVRGSSGYGKRYLGLDNVTLRENSVKDIGALLDWIALQKDLNKDRVGVYGGSYGGYMSLACMTHYNDRLRCGVDLFGISNFVTFLENTSAYRRDLRRAEYGDERDPAIRAYLTSISPNQHLDKITKPMFIYQGKNDPRVPQSESDQMVAALKAKNNAVWYVLAADEGHGLSKKANRDYTQAAISEFLELYLLKE